MSNLTSRAFHAPLTRADELILKVTLVLTSACALVVAVLKLIPRSDLTFAQAAENAGPAATPDGLADGVSVTWAPEQLWTIRHPSYGQILLAGLPTVIGALCVGIGALLLLSLVRAMARDRAFTHESLVRLRWLAFLVMFVGLVLPFISMLCRFALVANLQESPEVLFSVSSAQFAPILVGLLLLALAQVFSRGVELREDVEGLI